MQEQRVARWSRYLIYFILAVLPLERIPSFDLTTPIEMTVRLSQVAGLVLIAINLPMLWRSRERLLQNPWRWLVVFWGVCILSTGLATDLKRAVSVLAFTVFMGLLAWVVALRFERSRVLVYVKIVVVSALVTCGFGFYQFFGDLFGLPTSLTGLREAYTKHVFGFPRIQSTGLEPLYFGNFLLIPAGMLIVGIVNGWRKAAVWALLPIATVVWLSVSRGAIVALGLMLVAAAGIGLIRRKIVQVGRMVGVTLLSIGLAYSLLYVGTNFAVKKTEQTTHAIQNFSKQTTNISSGESSEGRSVTRSLAFEAFLANPVLGIGPGNFGQYAARGMPDRFGGGGAIVNNELLELLAETGLLGLGSLGVFVGLLLWSVVRAGKLEGAERVMAYGLGLAIVGIALQYQTFSTLYITHVWVTIGLLGGLMMVLRSETKAKAKEA